MFGITFLRSPVLQRSSTISGLVASSVLGSLRNYSSSPNSELSEPVIMQIEVPKNLSDQAQEAFVQFDKSLSKDTKSAPKARVIAGWREYISKNILKDYSEFSEKLRLAREHKPSIISITGLETPPLKPEEIPSEVIHLSNPEFLKKIKNAEILTGVFIELLGIKLIPAASNNLFTYVYASKNEADMTGSYRSSKEKLGWHNDGWKSFPPEYVALYCVNGHENALTEVVTTKQIIEYFRKAGKEDVLKELQEYYHMGEGLFGEQGPILTQDGKVRFADYGDIERAGVGYEKGKKAIEELNKCLKKISSFGKVLENGDLLIVNNHETLHQRKNVPGAKPEGFIGQRLLLRANGESKEQQSYF